MTAPAATATVGQGQDKVGVCHRTNSDSNPYVYIEVPASEANGHITGDSKQHNGQGRWKTAGTFRGTPHVAGEEKHDYYAESASQCNDYETVPSDELVTPLYPSATEAGCATDGHLVVPTQPDGVVVTDGGANGAGPGSYTFHYAPEEGFAFPEDTDTQRTVVVPGKTGNCPVEKAPVTPLYPSFNAASCTAGGTLVVPTQPAGVVVSGGAANGAGPGTYTFTYAPDATHFFPEGVATTKTVTVPAQLTGAACPTPPANPTVVTPNAPSTTPASCTAAGTVVAPAAQTGVSVVRSELGDGSVRFDSTPAAGFVFSGAQAVSATVAAPARLTGTQCAEVAGVEESVPPTKSTPTKSTPAVRPAQVAGVSASVPQQAGSAPVPNAVEAGLAGTQTDTRVLVGQALLGVGLLLFAASAMSGLGIRRRGVGRA